MAAAKSDEKQKARYRMFVDDTGNVHHTASNHPQARYAGITGVIFEWEYLHRVFDPGLTALKARHFGYCLQTRKPPILHLRKIKGVMEHFCFLTNKDERLRWHKGCFTMYRRAQYTIISVGVDKIAFYAKHPNWRGSFYELLVGNAIERYYYFLASRKGAGDVMAEAINDDRDKELRQLYLRFYERGTDHIPARHLQPVLTSKEIKIKPKDADIQGLQMADLLASTCFAHIRHQYTGQLPLIDEFAREVADLIEIEKFYRAENGNPDGYGRIWRPEE